MTQKQLPILKPGALARDGNFFVRRKGVNAGECDHESLLKTSSSLTVESIIKTNKILTLPRK